jgi:branched-subunit amino acid aminotransferase/4-amino-4-deoxychorismate lyase
LESLVFLNGRTVPASQACLPISDAGIVLGATVTEQTRTFHQRLWRLDDHLDLLYRSLRYMRLDIGLAPEELRRISVELVAHNAALLAPADELGLIQFVTPGEYATYAALSRRPARTGATVCVHTFPLPFELWAKRMAAGAHLVTPSVRHVPPQCYDPKVKYRSRLHFYLADQEARLVDPEATALLLDLQGNVTETSTANLLLVAGGTLVSPATGNIRPGVSRAMVIELAAKFGLPFESRPVTVYDVMNADEAFLASTPYCLMPVAKINGVAVGADKPGPVYERLLAAWSGEVGLDIGAQIQDGALRRTAAVV